MKYFEKNGYRISEMTLGTVQLGMNYGINNKDGKPSSDIADEILKTAEKYGITSFDTAAAYGDSENVLGRYFSKDKKSVSIVTKVHFGDISENRLFDTLVESVKKSSENLRLNKIPFLMLHNESYLVKYGSSIISALGKLKKEGLVDNIGVSFSDKTRLLDLCDTEVFDCIQLPLNMFDNKELCSGAVKKISDCGVAVFVRSIYLQGLFFIDPQHLPEKLISAREPLMKLRSLAENIGTDISELALSFIRSSNGINSVALGCETPQQVEQNAMLFEKGEISKTVREKIFEISETVEPIIIRPWEWKL